VAWFKIGGGGVTAELGLLSGWVPHCVELEGAAVVVVLKRVMDENLKGGVYGNPRPPGVGGGGVCARSRRGPGGLP